jgi:branched-chain amino acid transport system permease protein
VAKWGQIEVTDFLQFSFQGITTGFIFVLLTLGWVIVYRVSGIVNVTQGELAVLGALTAVTLAQSEGFPIWLAFLVGILTSGAAGGALDVIVLQRSRTNDHIALIVMTLGAAILLDELFRVLFGTNPLTMNSFLSTKPIRVAGAAILPENILVWATAAVALLAITVFFGRTIIGRALEACSQSPEGASVIGIPVKYMRTLAFAIGGLVSGLGGVLLSTLSPVSFSDGLLLGANGLTAAILANWSYKKLAPAAFILALSEAYAGGYLGSQYQNIVSMGVLVAVLLWRATEVSIRQRWRPNRARRMRVAELEIPLGSSMDGG